MAEEATEQTEEETAAAEAPDAAVESGADPGDAEMAAVVDQRAGELTGEDTSAAAGDPIAQAEDHIDSLDMDAERKKVEALTKTLGS